MLVLGDVRFTGGGAGFHLYGSLMVGGSLDQQSVGGNADILFSSLALSRLMELFDYTVLSWREM